MTPESKDEHEVPAPDASELAKYLAEVAAEAGVPEDSAAIQGIPAVEDE